MTIRSHLLLLAGFAAFPVLIFAVLISIKLIDQEQRTFERGAVERARAIMSAIDADLRGSFSTLDALAASRALAGDDLKGFHESASRLLATQPSWHDVTLALPSGEKVVDLKVPFGSPLGRVVDLPSAERAVRTRQHVVGNVARDAPNSPPVVPLRVPIVRDGAVRYLLTAQVKPDSFNRLIREQHLPDDWVSGLVDGEGNFVARVPPRPVGEPASTAFRNESRKGKEGWYRGLTVEGRDTFTAYQRSALADWAIGIAVPADIVFGAERSTAWLLAFGVLAAIATALMLSYFFGRRIVDPMTTLAAFARTVGKERQPIALPRTGVREVEAVGHALEQADIAMRERRRMDQREKDAIEAADRAKDEFIATLSHELRNPLAALTSATEILRRNDLDSGAGRDARRVIERQIGHMSRMIEDLLDLSRVIAGKTHLKLERFDLAALASSVVAAWQLEGRTARHSVSIETEPAWVHADRTRTEQVLANLLDNAIKFTAAGSRIRVVVTPRDAWAELCVEDDGDGIAPEMLDRVFEPFVQGNPSASRGRGGLGLGLALVKRLIELQQGTVTVESAGAGSGALFRVRLARVEPGVEPGPAIEPCATDKPGRHRILVIDDNDDARQSLAALLAFEGHETYEATNGAGGAEIALQVRPQVALVDIGLPDMSGYEVARRIRAALNRDIVLFAVTGYGQPEDQRRALDAGFDAHLVKPVTLEQLNEALAQVRPRSAVAERQDD